MKPLWSPEIEINEENLWKYSFPALIYNRCSTRNKSQKDYIKKRTKACRDWCYRTEQQLAHTVEDIAKTGKNLSREGIQKVRTLSKIPYGEPGFFKLIIVPEGSRVSRDAIDTAILLGELCREQGKIFYGVDDYQFFWTRAHFRELIKKAANYEEELDRLTGRLRNARLLKEKETGRKFHRPRKQLPVRQIIQEYKPPNPVSMYALAKKYKVNIGTIRRRLLEKGVEIRQNPKMIKYIKKLKEEEK